MKNVPRKTLERMAVSVHKHGNIRIGRANESGSGIGFFIGPRHIVTTDTKGEMYFYLLGRIDGTA